MQREYTGIYSGSGKRRPYVQRGGGECCISLHRSACVGVTSCERGRRSQVSRKRKKKGVMLVILILFPFSLFPGELSASSFIDSSGGRGVQKTIGSALEEKARRAL
jgi:hypothetical protein